MGSSNRGSVGKTFGERLWARLTQYGNFGGPNYGHGDWEWNSNTNKYEWKTTADPIDGQDQIYMEHDKAYGWAELQYNLGNISAEERTNLKTKADLGLLAGLLTYTPYFDPKCPDLQEAIRYRDSAIAAFVCKVLADRAFGVTVSRIIDIYDAARAQGIRISPLVLDLDGDGVETLALADGVYFDHDGDGFAEKTGWIAPDDGLLALDRNGNGTIDGGAELFGDQTVLAGGVKAADGFAALAELDGNRDGRIDAGDAAYTQLRIWRDLNRDGLSSADELSTLADLGIVSIDTASDPSELVDPQGNEHRLLGSFTRADGATGAVADVWFRRDTADTMAEEWLDVPEDIAALPNLPGGGSVYDLDQAMVRDTSGELKALVERFVALTDGMLLSSRSDGIDIPLALDPNERNQLLEDLLFRWAGVEDVDPENAGSWGGWALHGIDRRRLAVLEKFLGREFEGLLGDIPHFDAGVHLREAYQSLLEMFHGQLLLQTHQKDLFSKIAYSWDENAQALKGDLSPVAAELQGRIAADPERGKLELAEFVRSLQGLGLIGSVNYAEFRAALTSGGDEGVAFILDSALYRLDRGSSGSDLLIGAPDRVDALAGDAGDDCLVADGDGDLLYGQGGRDLLFTVSGSGVKEYGGEGTDGLVANGDNALLYGQEGHDFLFVIKGDGGRLYGGDGDDILLGYALHREEYAEQNRLYGGYREVMIYLEGIYDCMPGNFNSFYGNWEDIFRGNPGNDLLDGGAGMDILLGGDGSDTYVFGRGYGEDRIYETSGEADGIRFGEGMAPADVAVSRDESNLYFAIAGTGDRLVVSDFFTDGGHRVERVEFRDGTVWVLNDAWLDDRFSTATAGADFLWGSAGDDVLDGLDGDDRLHGGEGSDRLIGGAGDDLLHGGRGADWMAGGAGNDVYVVDDAGDVVVEVPGEGTDTVRSPVTFVLGDQLENLELILDNSVIETFLRGETDILETGVADIDGTGNGLDNLLTGNFGCNVLTGGAGNDTLDGRFGDDTLVGGEGDDTYVFRVGYGRDVIVETGDGRDVLQLGGLSLTLSGLFTELGEPLGWSGIDAFLNSPYGAHTRIPGILDDTFRRQFFGEGSTPVPLTPEDVFVSRDESNLYFHFISGDPTAYAFSGSTDVLTVTDWFADPSSRIEKVEFEGGTVWTLTEEWLEARFSTSTARADFLWGTAMADRLKGLSGNDVLVGNGGDDVLNGGAGADMMTGGPGNDVYHVDDPGDVVVENADEGTDTVRSSVSYTLTENVENLVLTGHESVEGIGNALNNRLKGNDGSNFLLGMDGDDVLNGGAGADRMAGGLGNDIYYVDDAGDSVIEVTEGGTDTVRSSISYALPDNVENLVLTGEGSLEGVGNDQDNRLKGNRGSNVLVGLEGDDILNGGGGSDVYLYRKTDGKDVITDRSSNATDLDVLNMTDALREEPVIVRQGNDLYLFLDEGNYVRVTNQFGSVDNGIERLQVSDGYYVSREDVETIINTMNAINNDPGMDLIQKYQAMRNDPLYISTLAQSWHQPQG
jgi:Ca2+-binding RTX toxin-like protein